MPLLITKSPKNEIDGEGFLKDFDEWDEDIARSFAIGEGIEFLTREHWRIINFIRNYYICNDQPPMVRRLCRETKITLEKLYVLFPTGLARGACKIAGLPQPVSCS
jgi:TusE/DsrC/DsvC family sulfur relay protein